MDTALVAMLRQAFAALQAGRTHDALHLSAQATQRAPSDFDAWRIRALAHAQDHDAAAQRDALQRACSLRPGDHAAAFDLGSLLLEAGEDAAAAPLLRFAMDAPQRDARAAFRYGTAQGRAGEVAEAITGFDEATRRAPAWVEAWLNLSAMRLRAGDVDAALDAARVAHGLQPDDPHVHHALAALLSHRFDAPSLADAWRHAQVALGGLAQRADVHRDASIVLRKLGRNTDARGQAERAHALAPDDPMVVETLGEQLLINRDAPAAVAVYAQAFDRGVRHPALQRQSGIALLQAGHAAAAVDALQAHLSAAPDDQRTIAHLGLALARSGRLDDALDLLGVHRHVHAIDLPVPAGFADMRVFNAQLARDIAAHPRQRWQPAGLAAHQAHLSGELRDAPTAAIHAFEALLRDALDGFVARCRVQAASAPADVFLRNVPGGDTVLHTWATQASGPGYIGTHIHEDSWLSGAYYVAVPDTIRADDAAHAGWIEFGRPFATLPAWPDDALHHVLPREGVLLLFPSYLFHRTLPHAGEAPRVSISFDLGAAAGAA